MRGKGTEERIRQQDRMRRRERGIEESNEAVGGKEEARDREGGNIKACFKGHRHFVPDDNHFPFVVCKCQTGHKAGLFFNSPEQKPGAHPSYEAT